MPGPASDLGGEAQALEVPDAFDDQPVVTTPPRMDQGQQTTPEKGQLVPKRSRKRSAGGELLPPPRPQPFDLVEVGLDHFRSWIRSRQRPRRHHIRVLDHWRNEQVVYERLPGSALPTVTAVVVAQPKEDKEVRPQGPEPVPLETQFRDELFPHVISPAKSSAAGSDYVAEDVDEEMEEASVIEGSISPEKPRRKAPPVQARTTERSRSRAPVARQRGKARAERNAAATAAAAAAATSAAAQVLAPAGRGRRAVAPKRRAASAGPVVADVERPAGRSSLRGQASSQAAKDRASSAPPVLARSAPSAPSCPHCGNVYMADAAYCRHCGERRGEADEEPEAAAAELEQLADGWSRVPPADGSAQACELRVGLDNGHWMCCDIRIPPRSFNTPEILAPSKSLIIHMMEAETGAVTADIDGEVTELEKGDSMVVRPGLEYCLRNRSDSDYAEMKMVLLNSQA